MISFSESMNSTLPYTQDRQMTIIDDDGELISGRRCVYAELYYDIHTNTENKWSVAVMVKPNLEDNTDPDNFEDYTFDGTYNISVMFATTSPRHHFTNVSLRTPVVNPLALFATIGEILKKEPARIGVRPQNIRQYSFENTAGEQDRGKVAVYSRVAAKIAHENHMRVVKNGPHYWVIAR